MSRVFEQVTGLSAWASYLVNGDKSGLSFEEVRQADAWRVYNGIVNVIDASEDTHFTWNARLYVPDADYDGAEVCEYTCELDSF